MFKPILLIGIVLLTISCSTLTTTTITNPSNEIWVVNSKSDALVKIEQGDVKVEVDNRGRVGFWEGLLQYLLIKPDITLSNQEGR